MGDISFSSNNTLGKEVRSAEDVPSATTNLYKDKIVNGRGRPKSKPASKLASFILPLELIDMIDKESALVSAGNKSLFMITLLENYFKKKQNC